MSLQSEYHHPIDLNISFFSQIDLKSLGDQLGTKGLRLADHNLLVTTLNIQPGHVNVYTIANDVKKQVILVLDDIINTDGKLNFHPMVNSATVSLNSKDVFRYLEHFKRKFTTLKFGME